MNNEVQLAHREQSYSITVNGRPRLLLGGQVHNSSMSSFEKIERVVAKAKAMNFNTVIGTVSWELVEAVEGQFDFDLVDKQIAEARSANLSLILIWFGAFKNAASTYAPTWVRADEKRFARAITDREANPNGTQRKPVLTAFSEELLIADRRAFVAFMKHLAETDLDNTVVAVQVENETGLLGASRDLSPLAEAAWNSAVPARLLESLVNGESLSQNSESEHIELWRANGQKTAGSWPEVFGDSWQSHEMFMAWHVASYVGALAAAGKSQKNLPMYANAWLGPQVGQTEAGQWPSGGPSVKAIDMWKLAAPALDFVSPDIYVHEALPVMAQYDRVDNPLFIPESRFVTGNMFWALGNHNAIGYSVFGAEDGRVDSQLAEAYGVLNHCQSTIARAQAQGAIRAILLEQDEFSQQLQFGDLTVTATNSVRSLRRFIEVAGVDLMLRERTQVSELEDLDAVIPSYRDNRSFGLVVQLSASEFLLIGQALNLSFTATDAVVEIDRVEEGHFVNEAWVTGRILNGDERLNFTPMSSIGCAKISILQF